MKDEQTLKESDQLLGHESVEPLSYPLCPKLIEIWDSSAIAASPFWDDVAKYAC